MATTFNPTDIYSTGSTSKSNWWDAPASSELGSSSVSGFNLPNYQSVLNSQRAGTGSLLSGQAQQTGNWLNNYSSALGKQETMPAMYTRIGEELGIPGLRNQAQTLTSTLEAIPQTYTDATRGFDVNANQLNRIVGTKHSKQKNFNHMSMRDSS
jgi:hypothetical protein